MIIFTQSGNSFNQQTQLKREKKENSKLNYKFSFFFFQMFIINVALERKLKNLLNSFLVNF